MKHFILPFIFLLALSGFSQEESPLILAIESNNLAQVKTLVEAGADVNEVDEYYKSALKIAIGKGNIGIVKFLIESGAEDRTGVSEAVRKDNIQLTIYLIQQKFYIGEAIIYAAENNNLEMVKLLATNGAKVDFSQKRRKGLFRKYYVSPIDKAVSHNNLQMVNVLVKHGLPINKAIESALNYGRNDLILALSNDIEDKSWLLLEAFKRSNDPIVKKLIAQGVSPNSEDNKGNSMLLIAASQGKLEKVQKCLEEFNLYLHKRNDSGENALMKAAAQGSLPVCTYLIEKGLTVDAQNNKGETALFYALGKNSRATFDFLVEKGADINHTSKDGNSLLIKAAQQNEKSTITYLITNSANVQLENKANKTAFYYVVTNSNGHSSEENKFQNTLIEAGADINTRGNNGETLLFKLIESGKLERIKELVSKGANPNTQDRNGERPSCSETEIIKFLILKGADINATDNWDNTYMCEAVKQNELELAHFLVEQGINLNKKCYFDEQALIKAVKEKNLTLVKFLAENGADVNAIGYFKKNVMDYAQKEGNQEIISYLRSRGAMTKEERNVQYEASMKLESEIKAALIAEDLETIISLMSSQDVVILQKKVVKNIAYVAAKKGHTQMINKLLSDDVDFNINSEVNDSGHTALTIATIFAQNELVIDLLAKGANMDQLDENGKTPPDFAFKKSTKKIFKKWRKKD